MDTVGVPVHSASSLHRLNSNAHKSGSNSETPSPPLNLRRDSSLARFPTPTPLRSFPLSPEASPSAITHHHRQVPIPNPLPLLPTRLPVSHHRSNNLLQCGQENNVQVVSKLVAVWTGKISRIPNTSSPSVLTPKRSFSLGQRPGKEKDKGGDKKSRSPIPTLPDLSDLATHPFSLYRARIHFRNLERKQLPARLDSHPSLFSSPHFDSSPRPNDLAPLISATLLFPASTSNPPSVPASPLRIHHGMSPCLSL